MEKYLNKYIKVSGKYYDGRYDREYEIIGICVNVTSSHIRILRDNGDGTCAIDALNIKANNNRSINIDIIED